MPDLMIELSGAQFQRAYLLYVVEVCHDEGKYYYIGQTGDNKYTTARPAFRRLAGHLQDSSGSTQNQVYQYIASNIYGYAGRGEFPERLKQQVEEFLVGSTVRMHVYKVEPFDPTVDHEKHLDTVRTVSLLERHVIQTFLTARKTVMNKKVTAPIEPCLYPNLLARIRADFAI